jgi:hypothetical protein
MNIQAERIRDTFNCVVEHAQTSKRALTVEAAGAVLGFAGAFVIERPVPMLILATVGFGSAMAGLANVEYQDAVHWQSPSVETASQ